MTRLEGYRRRSLFIGCVFALLLLGGTNAMADFTFGEPVNLGPPINTEADEVFACMSPDGLEFYFMDAYALRPGGLGGKDIWIARRSSVSEPWEEPVNLGATINTEHDDEVPCLSADGLTLYFSSTRPGGHGESDLYMSTRATLGDDWQEPTPLGPSVNGPEGDFYPFVSVDGLTLYFTSDREGGYGKTDTWVSTRTTVDDPWGEPVNLGPEINSSDHDLCPCASPDGQTLFFQSQRPGGYGQSDLWVTTRPSPSEPWTPPVCLLPNINTPSGDAVPRVTEDGFGCYFTSTCPGGEGEHDVYHAPILPIVDFDNDGHAGYSDLLILVECWGTDEPLCDVGPTPFGDSIVDEADLKVLVDAWGPVPDDYPNPRLARQPKPLDESISDVEKAVALGWTPGLNAAQHDVYVGMDLVVVEDADVSDTTGVYRGRQEGNQYTLLEEPLPDQMLYWRIDEFYANGTLVKGDLWSFFVADYLIVDDMESPDAIWFRWIDGWYDPNNGSIVWGDFSTVHSGGQSMSVYYDNSEVLTSQVERIWETPQDWTRRGSERLVLWLRGNPDNAAEPLHIVLQDGAGNEAVMTHPHSAAMKTDSWQAWSILLTDFTGVNPAAIQKMSIVIGDQADSQAGGSGTVYIDDITLHGPSGQ
ncbi:MAG: hypothetical protein GY809_17470 [Planctomycetes bacterium]|nr:hypothetical protein [Planctomycetota bacterium]